MIPDTNAKAPIHNTSASAPVPGKSSISTPKAIEKRANETQQPLTLDRVPKPDGCGDLEHTTHDRPGRNHDQQRQSGDVRRQEGDDAGSHADEADDDRGPPPFSFTVLADAEDDRPNAVYEGICAKEEDQCPQRHARPKKRDHAEGNGRDAS